MMLHFRERVRLFLHPHLRDGLVPGDAYVLRIEGVMGRLKCRVLTAEVEGLSGLERGDLIANRARGLATVLEVHAGRIATVPIERPDDGGTNDAEARGALAFLAEKAREGEQALRDKNLMQQTIDELRLDVQELEDANRSLVAMRDAALEGKLARAQPEAFLEEGEDWRDRYRNQT